MSVLLRNTDSDCPFGIFKLFFIQIPHINDVRFVFTSSCVGRTSYYIIYGCLRIVVSNTYCVVFLLCFASSCLPNVVSFSGLSFFDSVSLEFS